MHCLGETARNALKLFSTPRLDSQQIITAHVDLSIQKKPLFRVLQPLLIMVQGIQLKEFVDDKIITSFRWTMCAGIIIENIIGAFRLADSWLK